MARTTLLLPASTRFAGTALPASLAKALGRADRAMSEAGERAQLRRHVALLPDRWAEAALTRIVDAGEEDARLNGWLRADPAHIRPDINGVRLLACGETLGLGAEDAAALLPDLKPVFGDAGFAIDAPHPSRWYVRLPREAKLPAFAPPGAALGDDVFEHAPEGPEARRWRALDSEAQVILHNHPWNQARIAMGKPAVNALWFWGGGVLPDHARMSTPTIFSDDTLLQGVARLGKLRCMSPSDFQPSGDALVDLRRSGGARELAARIAALAELALAQRGSLELDFADGVGYTLRPGQRWRFWRRPVTSPG